MAYGNLNVDTITGSGASSVIVNNGSANVAGFTTGNNLQMLQNGGGIVFSNSSATTNSTLNDYETGTFTPTITANSGSITTYTSSGIYTKIGNVVFFSLVVTVSSVGSASSALLFSLPFTSSGNVQATYGREYNNSGYGLQGIVNSGQANGYVYSSTSNNGNAFSGGSGMVATISGYYRANF